MRMTCSLPSKFRGLWLLSALLLLGAGPAAEAPDAESRADSLLGDLDIAKEVEATKTVEEGDLQTQQISNWQLHSPAFGGTPPAKLLIHSSTKLGAAHSSGNSAGLTLDFLETLTLRKEQLTTALKTGGIYSRQQAVDTFNRYFFARPDLERMLNSAFYLHAQADYHTDKLMGIRHNYGGQLGLGSYLTEKTGRVLTCETGYHYSRELRVDPHTHEHIHSWAFGAEYTQELTAQLMLNFDGRLLFNLEHADDLRGYSQLTFRIPVSEQLAAAWSIDLRYDGEPVPGFEYYDLVQTAALVYTM